MANAKFQGSELQDQVDLATKIEYVLDDLFTLIEMPRNNRVEEELEEVSDEFSNDY